MKAAGLGLGLLCAVMMGVAGPADAQIAAGAPALAGSWKTACLPIGKNGRHGMTVALNIPQETGQTGEGPIEAVAQLFAKADCAVPTVHVVYEGKVALTQEAIGQFLVDQDTGSVTMTPQAEDVVGFYNAKPEEMGCGLSGWQLNQPRDVSGKTCSQTRFPETGSRVYDRAWLESGTLRFGVFPLKWDLTDPTQRAGERGPVVFERVGG
ncbi:hypothetical protein [Roseibium suaedae]|uniref:APCDD1 domain-containing protein n=1 Tax=Roseibium suaedae TaxID=735517 RepID=A0A1M7MYQ7_9HYPH|nr:hypothetical protein [Roseibium suaedae]SHM96333.1 hypothetical protein SAMN05444272_3619 [Roseibium suaedae]